MALLEDGDVVNLYVEGDELEHLHAFWNVDNVKNNNKSYCELCLQQLGLTNFTRTHHCQYCGRTVCKACRQNKRRLAKVAKDLYSVCDICDHELANW